MRQVVGLRGRACSTARPSHPHLIAATVAVAALIAGCNSNPDRTSATPAPSPYSQSKVEVEQAVLAAWRAEHQAYADALRAMDPDHPALAKTAIDPLLGSAKAFIALSKSQGLVARGQQDLGSPTVIELTPVDSPTSAIVEACVHGGLILYDPGTGKPVRGTAGQVTWNHERTTLRLVAGIGWFVAGNEVRSGPTEAICTSR